MSTNNQNDSALNTAGKVNFTTNLCEDFMLNEAFKTLRSNLRFCGDDIKTIVVTSSIAGEGKTTVSTELAKSLADIEKKTLLIYGDMRKPCRMLKGKRVAGLAELLASDCELSQVIYNTQNAFLDIIFNGVLPTNPVELLNTSTLADSLEQLKEKYDYIIIDSPPIMPVIDAALISTHCDGAVMVIAAEKASVQEIKSAKEQLEKSDCKILGAILNRTRESVHSKYYTKRYGYYADNSSRNN